MIPVVFIARFSRDRLTVHLPLKEINMSTEKAKAEYLADSPFWAAELIGQLERIAPGSALLWATDSVIGLLKEVAPRDKEKFSDWIRNLSFVTEKAAASSLMEKADGIWLEGQDSFHMAISHLFAAKARLLEGDQGFYRTHLVKAFMFLGNHEHCRRTSATTPLALFNRYMDLGSQESASTPPSPTPSATSPSSSSEKKGVGSLFQGK